MKDNKLVMILWLCITFLLVVVVLLSSSVYGIEENGTIHRENKSVWANYSFGKMFVNPEVATSYISKFSQEVTLCNDYTSDLWGFTGIVFNDTLKERNAYLWKNTTVQVPNIIAVEYNYTCKYNTTWSGQPTNQSTCYYLNQSKNTTVFSHYCKKVVAATKTCYWNEYKQEGTKTVYGMDWVNVNSNFDVIIKPGKVAYHNVDGLKIKPKECKKFKLEYKPKYSSGKFDTLIYLHTSDDWKCLLNKTCFKSGIIDPAWSDSLWEGARELNLTCYNNGCTNVPVTIYLTNDTTFNSTMNNKCDAQVYEGENSIPFELIERNWWNGTNVTGLRFLANITTNGTSNYSVKYGHAGIVCSNASNSTIFFLFHDAESGQDFSGWSTNPTASTQAQTGTYGMTFAVNGDRTKSFTSSLVRCSWWLNDSAANNNGLGGYGGSSGIWLGKYDYQGGAGNCTIATQFCFYSASATRTGSPCTRNKNEWNLLTFDILGGNIDIYVNQQACMLNYGTAANQTSFFFHIGTGGNTIDNHYCARTDFNLYKRLPTYTLVESPTPVSLTITLNSPANETTVYTTTPTLNFSVTSNASTTSCTAYVDSVPVGVNASVNNGTATIIVSNTSLTNGLRYWWVSCTGDSNSTTSATRAFTVLVPKVRLYYSTDNSNWTEVTLSTNNTLLDFSSDNDTFWWKAEITQVGGNLDLINFTFYESVQANNVSISPQQAYVNTTLNCTYIFTNSTGGTANDNSVIKWFVNNTLNYTGSYLDTTLGPYNFTRGQSIICQVIPQEAGGTPGSAVNSSQINITWYKGINITIEDFNTPKKWESGTTPTIKANVYDVLSNETMSNETVCLYTNLKDYGYLNCSAGGLISYEFTIPFVEEKSVYTSADNKSINLNSTNNVFTFKLYDYSVVINGTLDINSSGFGLKDIYVDLNNDSNNDLFLRGTIQDRNLIENRYNDNTTSKIWDFYNTNSLTKYILISTAGLLTRNITMTVNGSASNPEGIDFTEYWANTEDFNNSTIGYNGSAPTWMFDDLRSNVGDRWTFDTSGGALAYYDSANHQVITTSAAAVQCGSDSGGFLQAVEYANLNSVGLDMRSANKRWDVGYSCACSSAYGDIGFTSGDGTGSCTVELLSGSSTYTLYSCSRTGGDSGVLSLRQNSDGAFLLYEDDVYQKTFSFAGEDVNIRVLSYALASCTGTIGSWGSGTATGAITYLKQGGFGNNYTTNFSTGVFTLQSDIIFNTSNTSDSNLDIKNAIVSFDEQQPDDCDARVYLNADSANSSSYQEFSDGLFTNFLYTGGNLTFKIVLTVDDTDGLLACSVSNLNILVSTDFAANMSVYLGGSNVSYSYTNGDLNNTNTPLQISVDYRDLNNYLIADARSNTTLLVPFKVTIAQGSNGALTIYNISINQTLDDVQIPVNVTNVYLSTCTANHTALCNVTSTVTGLNGTMTISDVAIRTVNNGNITINASNRGANTTLDMVIRYSPINVTFTEVLIEDLFFNPYSNNQKNISPYGQYISRFYNRSILTLKSITPPHNIDVYVNLNDTSYTSTLHTYCFQESMNVTNQTGEDDEGNPTPGIDGNCGLNYTGNYTYVWEDLTPADEVYMNNGVYNSNLWQAVGDEHILNISYIKPALYNSAEWTVGYFDGDPNKENVTIPTACFNALTRSLLLQVQAYVGDLAYWKCWNGNNFTTITTTALEINEESITWIKTNNNATVLTMMNNTDKNTNRTVELSIYRQYFGMNMSYASNQSIYLLLDLYNVTSLPEFDWWEWFDSYCADTGDGLGACQVID